MLADFGAVIADYLLPSTLPVPPSKPKSGDFFDGTPDYDGFAHAAVADGGIAQNTG
jgi:hypothetical protein